MKIEVQRTRRCIRAEPCDPASLQRNVRQLLADKVSGNLVGLWLLIPEHLRLGTWDLLCGWSGQPGERAEPRLALQLVHEAALCSTGGLRHHRVLSQRGFELAKLVDRTGRAIVCTTSLERAELKRDQIHAYGPDDRIPRCAGSMQAELEAAE